MKQAFLNSGFFISQRCSGHNNNFNLLRFIAASLVLVAHSNTISMGPEFHAPFHDIAQGRALGNWAVLIFFAISGFFITRSYNVREDWRAFISARLLRLFPGLAGALFVTIAISGLLFTTASQNVFWAAAPEYFLRNLTMFYPKWSLPGVFPDNPYTAPEYGVVLNGSLWTLSFEFLCYMGVLFAGVAGILRRPMLFAACVLAILGLAVFVELYDIRPRITNLARLSLPFALGASMWIWRRYMFMHWAIALALCLASVLFVKTTAFHILLPLCMSYCALYLGYARLSLLGFNRFGDYSYGIYIYAFPIQQMVTHLTGGGSPVMNIILSFPLTLAMAVLSWNLVEKPALGFRRIQNMSIPENAPRNTAGAP